MGMKSRLFASAAFPLLSLAFAVPPVGAYAAVSGGAQGAVHPVVEGSYEMAQDAPSEEELLKKKKKLEEEQQRQQEPAEKPRQSEAPAERAPEPEQKPKRQREPEPQAAPEAQAPAAEEPARPRRQREAQPEQAAPEQQAPAAEEPQRPRRQRQAQPEQPAEQPKRQRDRNKPSSEQAAPDVQQPAEQAPAAGEAQQPAEKPRQRPKPKAAEQPAEQTTERPAEPQQGDKKPAAAEQAAPSGEAPAPIKKPAAAEQPAPVEKPATAEKPAATETPATAEKPAAGEQPANSQTAQPVPGQQPEQPAAIAPQPGEQPAAGAPQQTEQAIPAPEKVTPQELERRKEIAQDPAKSTETIVLPVENGAAVLDSDKDADRSQGRQGRRDRDRQRADSQDFKLPTSDAEAQSLSATRQSAPVQMEAITREQGRRMDRRPQFDRPEGANYGERTDDSRIIIQFGDRTVVRSDDDRRFLRDGERPSYEELSGDRYRETIMRPEGYRIVTIRNRYGDIIQRSRVDARGREDVLYYSPELYEDPDRDYFEDPGADLPPMRLRVPLDDYIIDTSTDPDRDYYEFLSEPPVEPVERVYSLNEVKYSARIRDKVRRIDLDTVTFATGSAEIPMSQARTLRKVADAINEVLDKNKSETFLIEGHTDAVGSDQSNLILSDQRAESVANVLTDVYGIPPENLATQGYGERYLKVNTLGPNQENRRVTIRRVTPLVRPVAQR
ncbi:outer membrane protein OmpA-like peptidoglycan-associated protein [Rhizobium sp. BK275]|uniref:OmpA family protein n=1 Tax=unclassified Rhizobium TaxID=2613769 RepID=UPI00160B46E9|nr:MULTISPECIES: OmpA family protein [unclassified Rhizobium]MBB3391717.1 outer membrane protein OmpA-like peptidoglycan-associated protein [Rhizobium sp. BK275]MBB3410126.1 outer membrane protein OmpA-like peptidoglycan-associated protein [Rhizobium sp. BK316]